MVRVFILGGGFGGVYTALNLQRRLRRRQDVSLTLVSAENYFLFYPLLPEAGLGDVEPDHPIIPIRSLGAGWRFVRAAVTAIDPVRRIVHTTYNGRCELPYDHLVIALGSEPELRHIPGATPYGLTFQNLSDAFILRNHVIRCFEEADVEPDPAVQRELLTFVTVGGGFTGVEVAGELESFARGIARYYPHVDPQRIGLVLLQLTGNLLPELDPELGWYATRALRRRGVDVRLNTATDHIEADRLVLRSGELLLCRTAVVTTGTRPASLLATLPWAKDRKGRLLTRADLQVLQSPRVWALGDCAAIPDPSGGFYPATAQHALREARHLAENLMAVIDGQSPTPFRYRSLGTMVNLGRHQGVAKVLGWHLQGLPAWLLWRGYYLARMPRWDRQLRVLLDWLVRTIAPRDLAQLPMAPPSRITAPVRADAEAPRRAA